MYSPPPLEAADVPLTTTRVASGLSNPVFVTQPPGGNDDRLFVIEQVTGSIRIVHPDGTLTQYLNIAAKIDNAHGEQGLLGLAFHPDYTQNGHFYVYYTATNDDSVVERYNVLASNPNVADAGSGVEILRVPQPFPQHNAGMMEFGPDGYLYIAFGDGGFGYDPFNHGQNVGTLLGQLIRIDVDGAFPYAIPPTNPFASREMYAYGLRNPWRFSIDTNGDIYIGDVGQEMREEINFVPAGAGGRNFGWRCFEGDLCLTQFHSCVPCTPTSYAQPIHLYDHNVGCSVTGGYVYRGCNIPGLQGTYFFGDFCSGDIWSMRYDGSTVTELENRTAELAPGGGLFIGSISSFGKDSKGELYICSYYTGEVYRIDADLPLGSDCNNNGVGDGCEIAAGSAPDANDNGVIDTCEHLLTVDPLALGTTATFQFVGANASEPVYFVAGLGGVGAGPCFGASLCLGVTNPIFVLATIPADTQGMAALSVFIPPTTPLIGVGLQAVLFRGPNGVDSILSNTVAGQVTP